MEGAGGTIQPKATIRFARSLERRRSTTAACWIAAVAATGLMGCSRSSIQVERTIHLPPLPNNCSVRFLKGEKPTAAITIGHVHIAVVRHRFLGQTTKNWVNKRLGRMVCHMGGSAVVMTSRTRTHSQEYTLMWVDADVLLETAIRPPEHRQKWYRAKLARILAAMAQMRQSTPVCFARGTRALYLLTDRSGKLVSVLAARKEGVIAANKACRDSIGTNKTIHATLIALRCSSIIPIVLFEIENHMVTKRSHPEGAPPVVGRKVNGVRAVNRSRDIR